MTHINPKQSTSLNKNADAYTKENADQNEDN